MADENDDSDPSQKTEDPTPKRLEEARKKGQVALSREVNNFVMLLAAALIIGAFSGSVFGDLNALMLGYLEHAHDVPSLPGGAGLALGEGLVRTLIALSLPFLILLAAAFIGPFAQIGPIFSAETITPKFSKISPVDGFWRLFSKKSLVEFVKGLLKIILIGAVGIIVLYPYFYSLDHMVGLPQIMLAQEMHTLVMRLMIGMLCVLFVIAVADFVYQRWEFMQKMRMSRQDLKDEYKQTEGDPQIKAKLRQVRMERARKRMMQAVPKADVVITNPTHYAIALSYKPEVMDAPVCVAKGLDNIALKIREIAKEHDIVIYENPPLARALYDTVELEETIPAEQYKAVAEVISFVFKTRGRKI